MTQYKWIYVMELLSNARNVKSAGHRLPRWNLEKTDNELHRIYLSKNSSRLCCPQLISVYIEDV